MSSAVLSSAVLSSRRLVVRRLVVLIGWVFRGFVLLRKSGVGDVLPFVQKTAIELDEFGGIGGLGRRDTGVGGLFAHDGVALPGDHLRVLDVDVVAAGFFSRILVGGDLGHDGVGGFAFARAEMRRRE